MERRRCLRIFRVLVREGDHVTTPLRKDAQANRAKLLTAAAELFAEEGLDVTLDDIAARAKVGVGTAYRNFANKDVLIDDLLVKRIQDMVEVAERCLEIEDPWTALRAFLELSLEMQVNDRGLKQVLFSRSRGHVRVDAARERLAPAVGRLVQRAHDAGQLREDVHQSDLPIISILVGTVIDFARDIDPVLHLRYLEILLAGLRADGQVPAQLPAPPLQTPEFERAMRRWHAR